MYCRVLHCNVWKDVGIKSLSIFFLSWLKSIPVSFFYISTIALHSCQIFVLFIVWKFLAKIFKNSPISSHCRQTHFALSDKRKPTHDTNQLVPTYFLKCRFNQAKLETHVNWHSKNELSLFFKMGLSLPLFRFFFFVVVFKTISEKKLYLDSSRLLSRIFEAENIHIISELEIAQNVKMFWKRQRVN